MHGNEAAGREIILNLANHLLVGYNQVNQILEERLMIERCLG